MFDAHNSLDKKTARNVRIATVVGIIAVAIGISGGFHSWHNLTTLISVEILGLNSLWFAREMAIDRVAKHKTLNFQFILGIHRIVGIIFLVGGITLLLQSSNKANEITKNLMSLVFIIPGIFCIFFGSRLLIQKGILGGSKSNTTRETSESSSFYKKYNEGFQYLIFGIIFTLGVMHILWWK